MNKSLCRIGVFYDGSFFTYAQKYFYADLKLGWLAYTPFHTLIENHIREKEQGYGCYRVVYAAWFQGLFSTRQSDDQQRRTDRNRDLDLMHAGIEPRYVPMSQTGGEKGIDVALAVDAMQIGLQGTIDVAALVTGDGDFVPLVRSLMKQGVPVTAEGFYYGGVINFRAKSAFNGVSISGKRIRGDLNPMIETARQVLHETPSVVKVALSNNERRNDFRIPVQSNEGPNVTPLPASRSCSSFQ